MKTNKFWSIVTIFVLTLSATIALSSCNKNEDVNNNGKSKIVGTWKCSKAHEYETLTFKPDGSGTWEEYEDGVLNEIEKIKWSYEDATSMLIIMFIKDNGRVDETEVIPLIWINEKTFVFAEDNLIWEKQK